MPSVAWRFAGAALAVLFAGTPGHAHHYGLSAFDTSKPVRVAGVLARVEWTNPHAKFYVDGKSAGSAIERWIAETASPGTLTRLGLDRSHLAVGDSITLVGFRANDGSRWMIARTLTLSGGSVIDLSQ
jgi:hypothetical protein